MIARCFTLGIALVLASTAPAGAHVTVRPSSASAGEAAALVFHCPNERSASGTIELVVEMPEDVALPGVTVPPLPGWHIAVTRKDGVVDTIAWSGGRIAPGASEDFPIVTGPLPRVDHPLLFRAIQTYDNGEVVRWIQERGPGESEPPFPAPHLIVK
jgi:uncharacterized protein YcnI